MRIALHVLGIFFFVFLNKLSAQCPSNDSLLRRISGIANAPSVSEADKQKKFIQLNAEISRCPGNNDSVHAFLLRRIGASFSITGNYSAAIEWTQKAVAMISNNASNPAINYSHLASCYYNLQSFYDSLGMESLYQQAIDSCIAVDLRTGVYKYSSYLWNDKLQILFNKGDYVLCVKYAELTENNFAEYFPDRIVERWAAVVHHTNALIFLKKYDEAEQFLLSKIKSFNNESYAVQAYGLLGMINFYKKSDQKAVEYFQKTAVAAKKTNNPGSYGWAMNWLGFIYADRLKNNRSAMDYYKKALLYADSIDAPSVLYYIANLYVSRNLFDSAFYFFQKSFDRIKPGINEKDLINKNFSTKLEGNAIEYVVTLVNYKADAFLAKYRLTKDQKLLAEAIEIYKVADKLLNQVKAMQLEPETKLFWRAHTKEMYEHAIEACFLSNNVGDGFYFFERSRAVLLNDQLYEQKWLAAEDITKKQQLEKIIAAQEKELNRTANGSYRYLELQKQLMENRQALERLHETIKANNPLYYQSFVDPSFINLKDVGQKLLKDHEGLVELFSGDSVIYLIVTTSSSNYFSKINKKIFDSLSNKYVQFISHPIRTNDKLMEFTGTAYQLYKLMFENVKLPGGRIIISPDEQYFPFESLVTDVKTGNYFLNDYVVSYTYSARYLLNQFTSNRSTHEFLGIAPVQFSNGLASLPGSDESLRLIQNYFGDATYLLSNQASKNNFLDAFPNYRIIQLYTHATDSGSNGEPMIYFSDSTLSLSELFYGKKPATDLIVLSACETALGQIHTGEGVFSFNRGFAALGIPSAISNLWQVNNEATYKITKLFYKYLAKGQPLDLALNNAKKEFISSSSVENKMPYFWAAPILVGQTNTILVEGSMWKWIGLMALFLIIAIWMETKAAKKKLMI